MLAGSSRSSIGTRVGMTIAIVLLGLLITLGAGIYSLRLLEKEISELVNISTVKSDAATKMQWAILARVNAVRNIALSSDVNAMQADQKQIEEVIQAYQASRKTLQALPLSAQDRQALANADKAEVDAAPLLKTAQALARTMQPEMAAETLSVQLSPVQQRWQQALDELSRSAQTERAASLQQVQNTRQRAQWTMLLVGALALCVGGVAAIVLVRSIRQRLLQAVAITQRIASGDLSQAVHADGHDEVSQTLQALASMQDRLKDVIHEVHISAEAIECASSEIAHGTQHLSTRTEQSAASLQETASSMEQLNGTAVSAAHNASDARDLMGTASDVAERGGQVVSQVVRTMSEIEASSRRISDITTTIDGIAFQTNILALNAAVEAARAGEQGRGFAVVAGEVRSLAQRAATAAREIKSLIQGSVEKVASGTQLADDAGQTMQEVVSSVHKMSAVIGEIAHSTQEQTHGINQVNTAISSLDRMTQENAALVEQSAAAAESMREQATRLTQVISHFNVH
jgi:methyl-accepting chemotaxis protein